MAISVLDFYKEKDGKDTKNPFLTSLHEPTFVLLVKANGKIKEFVLKLSGEVKCPSVCGLKDFELESYRNYLIITDFLLGENRDKLRQRWGFTKEDFKELIFELYFCMIKEHAPCSLFKKMLLILIGSLKFFVGRKLK